MLPLRTAAIPLAVLPIFLPELYGMIAGIKLLLDLLQRPASRLHQRQIHGDGSDEADARVHPERSCRRDGLLQRLEGERDEERGAPVDEDQHAAGQVLHVRRQNLTWKSEENSRQ